MRRVDRAHAPRAQQRVDPVGDLPVGLAQHPDATHEDRAVGAGHVPRPAVGVDSQGDLTEARPGQASFADLLPSVAASDPATAPNPQSGLVGQQGVAPLSPGHHHRGEQKSDRYEREGGRQPDASGDQRGERTERDEDRGPQPRGEQLLQPRLAVVGHVAFVPSPRWNEPVDHGAGASGSGSPGVGYSATNTPTPPSVDRLGFLESGVSRSRRQPDFHEVELINGRVRQSGRRSGRPVASRSSANAAPSVTGVKCAFRPLGFGSTHSRAPASDSGCGPKAAFGR